MDLRGLTNGFIDIIGRGAAIEMNRDRVLSCIDCDDWRRNGEQSPVFREIRNAQCGGHDDKSQRLKSG